MYKMLQQLPSDIRKHILCFLRENVTIVIERAGTTFEQELFRYDTRCFCMLVFSQPRAVSIPVFHVPFDVIRHVLVS